MSRAVPKNFKITLLFVHLMASTMTAVLLEKYACTTLTQLQNSLILTSNVETKGKCAVMCTGDCVGIVTVTETTHQRCAHLNNLSDFPARSWIPCDDYSATVTIFKKPDYQVRTLLDVNTYYSLMNAPFTPNDNVVSNN